MSNKGRNDIEQYMRGNGRFYRDVKSGEAEVLPGSNRGERSDAAEQMISIEWAQ